MDGAPAVRRLGARVVRKLSAPAVKRLGWCSCFEKASCCEKAWCSCCEKLVIARDRVCDRFLFEDAIVVIINDDKCIFISVCCLLNFSGAVMVSIGR